jgi:hypothetical protein
VTSTIEEKIKKFFSAEPEDPIMGLRNSAD